MEKQRIALIRHVTKQFCQSSTFASPLNKEEDVNCAPSHGVALASTGGLMSMPAAPTFEEGDLVLARKPGAGFRPARVVAPASADSPLVSIAFTGNPTRFKLDPKDIRRRGNLHPSTHRQPANVVVDLTLSSDDDTKRETLGTQEVEDLVEAVKSTIQIAPRPSFAKAFPKDADNPPTPTKCDLDDKPSAPIASTEEYHDPYAHHPIANFPPRSAAKSRDVDDPYERFAIRPPTRRSLSPPLRDPHAQWGPPDYDEPHAAFSLSGSQYGDFVPRRDRSDRGSEYDRCAQALNDYEHDGYSRGFEGRAHRDQHGSQREYCSDSRIHAYREPPSPAPTEDIPVPSAEVVREQQQIGIHPDLTRIRIPRKNASRPRGPRRFPSFEEDDAISNRHPRTWREMHMTTGGFSAAEKTARREAARRRTSPKVPVRSKPVPRPKSRPISEESGDGTASTSSEDELSDGEMTLADIRKAIYENRPVEFHPNDMRQKKKLQTLQLKDDVAAAGGPRRRLAPKLNTGALKKKKLRTALHGKPQIIDLDVTETDKSHTSSDNSRSARRRKPKKRPAPPPPKHCVRDVPRPPPLPTRGSGRRKSMPRRNAGKHAIALAGQIDEFVRADYRAYCARLERQSFEDEVFENFEASQQSPSSKRFFSCTCGAGSSGHRGGRIVRCILCARYSHVWCTGLSKGDIEQLNGGEQAGTVQFVCVKCTEMVSEENPPHGKAFPTGGDPRQRFIVPPLVFPIFDILRINAMPRTTLLALCLARPKREPSYHKLSREDLQKMRRNVDLFRAGCLPRSAVQGSVSRLLVYD